MEKEHTEQIYNTPSAQVTFRPSNTKADKKSSSIQPKFTTNGVTHFINHHLFEKLVPNCERIYDQDIYVSVCM